MQILLSKILFDLNLFYSKKMWIHIENPPRSYQKRFQTTTTTTTTKTKLDHINKSYLKVQSDLDFVSRILLTPRIC